MQRRRTLEQFPAAANRQPAAAPAAQPEPMPHYVGPTLKLIAMLITSWLKSADSQNNRNDASSFEVTLPGTRTKLAYNAHGVNNAESISIYDEVMEISWTPGTPTRSTLPNPTDPRIAGNIFMLLEETHDCEMERILPSLRADTRTVKYVSNNSALTSNHAKNLTEVNNPEKDKFFLKNINLFFSPETLKLAPENYRASITLNSLTVEGRGQILRFIECLEAAFEKHKQLTIPVPEHAAARMNFGQ